MTGSAGLGGRITPGTAIHGSPLEISGPDFRRRGSAS